MHNVYRRNINRSKKKGNKYQRDIATLIPIYGTDDSYDEDANWSYTSSYIREDEMYSQPDYFEIDVAAENIFNFFKPYLINSEPLKIQRSNILMERGEEDISSSYIDRLGNILGSYEEIIASMPASALDAIVTVQTKDESFMGDTEGCRICRDSHAKDGNESSADDDDDDDTEGDNEDSADDGDGKGKSPVYTTAEIFRHQKQIADSRFTIVPGYIDDDLNQFSGQEDQITEDMRLGDALNIASSEKSVMVAQVSIFSNRSDESDGTSNATITVGSDGCLHLGKNQSNNSSLSMLLPWIRLPAFLLPTEDGSIEIREINLWASSKEVKTSTHYDGHHNLLIVLCGVKTVELSPPDLFIGAPVHSDHANHPYLLRCKQVGGNLVNEYFTEDTSKYMSNHAEENNIVVSVAAGDAIFIPEGWWHRVESSSKCIAINVWFDHKGSSISAICHKSNQHLLTYQARELVRQFIAANIEEVNKQRLSSSYVELLGMSGFGFQGFVRNPGRLLFEFLQSMSFGRIVPTKRTRSEIEIGQQTIEKYTTHILNTLEEPDDSDLTIPSLQQLALPKAIGTVGHMISFFVSMMDPINCRLENDDEACEEDRRAIITLFNRLTTMVTNDMKRRLFIRIIENTTAAACYSLTVTWEKHTPVSEAKESLASFFSCVGDMGRRVFMAEVDAFRNESARMLILGDLMLLNPVRREDQEIGAI